MAEPDGQAGAAAPPAAADRLTDDVLVTIFQHLEADCFGVTTWAKDHGSAERMFAWFRRTLPAVCSRWREALGPSGHYSWPVMLISPEKENAVSERKPAGGCVPPMQPAAVVGSPPFGRSPPYSSLGRKSAAAPARSFR